MDDADRKLLHIVFVVVLFPASLIYLVATVADPASEGDRPQLISYGLIATGSTFSGHIVEESRASRETSGSKEECRRTLHRHAAVVRLLSMRRKLGHAWLLAAIAFGLAACDPATSAKQPDASASASASPTLVSDAGPARTLGGGSYEISRGGTRPGEPFDVTAMEVSMEVENNTKQAVVPVCIVDFGSQTVLVDVGQRVLAPGGSDYLSGEALFPRPLDDYESGDAGCFTRLPNDIAREMEREERALTMGTVTEVPNLVGKRLAPSLPSFRRGLRIRIVGGSTSCTKQRLLKVAHATYFPAPPCGKPVVTTQDPAPGANARVGDFIDITVVPQG